MTVMTADPGCGMLQYQRDLSKWWDPEHGLMSDRYKAVLIVRDENPTGIVKIFDFFTSASIGFYKQGVYGRGNVLNIPVFPIHTFPIEAFNDYGRANIAEIKRNVKAWLDKERPEWWHFQTNRKKDIQLGTIYVPISGEFTQCIQIPANINVMINA